MADLIDRERLLEIVGGMSIEWEYGAAVSDIYKIIKEQRRVNAELVAHGRWEANLNPFWDAECSECGYTKKNGWEWRFCPNCGAKMDGRDDE